MTDLKTNCHDNIGLSLLRFVRLYSGIYELDKFIEDGLQYEGNIMLYWKTIIIKTEGHTF